MSSRHTPPRLGFRVPPPPPPRDPDAPSGDEGTLREGDLLDGRYQIEDQVGEGGVGVVYRALQLKLHRRVAVKLLQQETDDQQRPRFEREAVTLAALSHPNIVSLQDYGHTRGRPFLVMELLAGRTLRELVDVEGALAVPRALALTQQILHALAYANSLGIVHRDLKPANLLVQALPAYEHVKVLDFGFVKLLPGSYLDRGVQLSRVGFTFGTPAYMSPEHATGGEVDGRSDLYSMGILLFEMLTGTKPFEGELPELIRHHLSTPVPKLAERRAELAGRHDLQALIDRAMAKPRDERFPDAAAFLQAIENLTVLAPGALHAEASFQSPSATLAGPPRQALGLELERLGVALHRFGLIAYANFKERAGPALKRAGEQLRAFALQVWTLLRTQAIAAWAWTKPRITHLTQRSAPRASSEGGESADDVVAPSPVMAAPAPSPAMGTPAPAPAMGTPAPSGPAPYLAPQAVKADVPALASVQVGTSQEPASSRTAAAELDPGRAATVDLSELHAQAEISAGVRPARDQGDSKRDSERDSKAESKADNKVEPG